MYKTLVIFSLCFLVGCVPFQTQTVENDPFVTYPNARHNFSYNSARQNTSQMAAKQRPSLIVTNGQSPSVIYEAGSRDTYLKNEEKIVLNFDNADRPTQALVSSPRIETLVGRKVKVLFKDMVALQQGVNKYDERLSTVQMDGDGDASEYYAMLAVINTHLQSGTTAGNPELVEFWNGADRKLQDLNKSAVILNSLAANVANEASKSRFLMDATQATFGLSGAVEEDHENLTALEDEMHQTVIRIDRMLTVINDEINRRSAFLRSENMNMQTLSLAISNGELYGQSMASRLFARVASAGNGMGRAGGFAPDQMMQESKRPLVIIRFDRPDVQYKQPLYTALSQALERYPASQFEVISVSPAAHNPAAEALASAKSRKNGEHVLRTMTQMGVPANRVNMNTASDANLNNAEVHIFIHG